MSAPAFCGARSAASFAVSQCRLRRQRRPYGSMHSKAYHREKTSMLRWSTGLIAGALLAFAPLSADAETWKGYTFLPSVTHPAYKNFAQMGEEFAKVSDGRITVRTSAGGQLPINATAITQAVGDGIIHFAHDGFYSGNIPIGLLPFLPLLVNDWDDFQKVVAVIRPYLESELEKRGVKLLATYN